MYSWFDVFAQNVMQTIMLTFAGEEKQETQIQWILKEGLVTSSRVVQFDDI